MGRDYGSQYRHGFYPHSPEQMEVAKACVAQAQAKLPAGKRCHTEVVEAQTFWPAEEMHRAPQSPHTPTPCRTDPRDRDSPSPRAHAACARAGAEQYLQKGGRLGNSQSASKGCLDSVRCYG